MLDKFFELFRIACNLFRILVNQTSLFKLPNVSMFDYEKNVIFKTMTQTNAFFMNRENENNSIRNVKSIALAMANEIVKNEDDHIEKSRKRKLEFINNSECSDQNEFYRYNLRSRRV